MYVAVIPNRRSPPAILLRESYRENGKTKNRTVANLSSWPAEKIEQLRAVLRGERLLPAAQESRSFAPCRTAMVWRRSGRRTASISNPFCPAEPRSGSATSRRP